MPSAVVCMSFPFLSSKILLDLPSPPMCFAVHKTVCLQLILSHIYNSLLIFSLCPVFLLVWMRGDYVTRFADSPDPPCQPKLSKASNTKKPDSFWSLGECENTNKFWRESDVKVTPFPGSRP